MLIIGAKSFAKELLEIFKQRDALENLVFYDDIHLEEPDSLYNQFSILRNKEEAKTYFRTIDTAFTLGIGNPALRKKLTEKFTALGGVLTSSISVHSRVGSYEVCIGTGTNVLDGACISNSVSIGKGCIVYYQSVITHDCQIGDFVEISPNVIVLGRAKVGDYCQIGAGSTLLPDVQLGTNVVVGAGSVVTKSVPDNSLVVGVPGKIIKKLPALEL